MSDVHLFVFSTMMDFEPAYAVAYINNPAWQKQPGRYRVRTVGLTRDPVVTTGGLTILPDLVLADVRPAESALLLLPGGEVWETAEDANQAAVDAAARFLEAGVPVAAICGATLGLARAGLLDERAHTSNMADYLRAAPGYKGAARYRDELAVADRGLITAGAVGAIEFAAAIFTTLDMYESSFIDAWRGLFKTGDPVYFAQLEQASTPPA